jgi:hypothetical protein
MSNKIIARIVATVMVVMALCTVSFAASLTNDVLDIAGEVSTTNTVKTVLAFYASDKALTQPASDDDIIVLDQIESGSFASFNVDSSKTADDYVVVLYGGDKGDVAKTVLGLDTANDADITIARDFTLTDAEGNEKTYTDLYYITNTFEGAADNYGFYIENGDSGVGYTFEVSNGVAGEGTFKYGLMLLGVPESANVVTQSFVSAN